MNLLRNFDYEGYQVDLYLSDRKSFWHVDFPEQLTIKYLPHIPRIYSFMPFDTAKKPRASGFLRLREYDLAIDFNSYQLFPVRSAHSPCRQSAASWHPTTTSA